MENFKVISKLGKYIYILTKIGEGAYSIVYKVKRIIDNNIYALKKVKLLNLSEKEKLNSLNEVRILASVKSNFVISYKEAFYDEKDNTLGIVMEYADNGDLYQKIVQHKKSAKFFEETDIWKIFIQLIKGLKALHDLKILHRDLKSANVFLEKNGCAKLGDLNVSKVAKRGLGYTQTGTPYYASPEVWKDKPYNNKSDLWSLGCVLYEMITLRPPFRAENMEGLYNKVIRGNFSKIPERFSTDLQIVLNLLLKVQPELRPSCEELLKNPIIQKRIDYFKSYCSDEISEDQSLLQTIKIPKNLLFLSDKLPKPNYQNNTNQSLKKTKSFSNVNETEKKTTSAISMKSFVSKNETKEDIKQKSENVVNINKNIINHKIIRNNSGSNLSLVVGSRASSKIRQMSPKQNNNILLRNQLYPNNLQIKNEYPKLKLNRNKSNINNIELGSKIPKNKYNNKSNVNVLNNLYKIYAPYINVPYQNRNVGSRNRKESPDIRYYYNYEKYLNEKYNLYKEPKKIKKPEIKIIPKRKLSPIRRNIF